jgi:DNA polymerase
MAYIRPEGLAARKLLLEKTYEVFDRNPPGPIAALRREGSDRFVPGNGSFSPAAVVIGEAPGAVEAKQGMPFVGKSGRFLTELLRDYSGVDRNALWITNVVKYRPPQNRTPSGEEIAASLSLLKQELALVGGNKTRAVIGLGRVACEAMVGERISMMHRHGTWVDLRQGWTMFVSYHPATALRSVVIRNHMRADFSKLGADLTRRALARDSG